MQDGVAVGRGLRDQGFTDGAAGPAAIFDDELLAQNRADLGVEDTRGGVGAAGRRIRHHHLHRTVRPRGLGAGAGGRTARRPFRPIARGVKLVSWTSLIPVISFDTV